MQGGPASFDPAILDLLLRHPEPQTLHGLALASGRSMESIRDELAALEMAGCRIEWHPGSGVRLLEAGLGTWQDYLQWRLALSRRHHGDKAGAAGLQIEGNASHGTGEDLPQRRIEIYNQTASTQDAARRMVTTRPERVDGAVIAAGHQSAGRGRLGRRWTVPPGTGATFSYIHCIHSAGAERSGNDLLWLATAVAVVEALETFIPAEAHPPRIKWPNDVLIDGQKVAGILIETAGPRPADRASRASTAAGTPSSTVAAIIGIGINVAIHQEHLSSVPPDVAARMTSLALHGCRVDRLLVKAAVLERLEHRLHLLDREELLRCWRRRCIQLGTRVHLRCNGEDVHGQVLDVDPDAGLIVRTDTGTLLHLPAATTSVL